MNRSKKSPTMIGPFAEVANDFIIYKRSAGFKYENEAKCLSRFCCFSMKQGISEIEISRDIAEKWIAPREGESKKSRGHRITCIRQFSLYLNALGYDAYIVPEVKGIYHNSFVPYIFTHQQIADVINAADNTTPREVARNMHLALPVIFRILYGCGLRVSEVVKLQYKDVNLEDGILIIREAKTDKDRYIPLSDSVKQACINYAENIWWDKDDEYFFFAPDRTMISPMTVYQRYRRYLEVAGISHGGKGQGPRLHDIRHSHVSLLIHMGFTALAIGNRVGHESEKITYRYSHLFPSVQTDMALALDKEWKDGFEIEEELEITASQIRLIS